MSGEVGETKPIRRGRTGKAIGKARSLDDATRLGNSVRNKANWPERIMQNEPNLPIRAQVGTGRGTSLAGLPLALIAQTNPICLRAKRRASALGKRIYG